MVLSTRKEELEYISKKIGKLPENIYIGDILDFCKHKLTTYTCARCYTSEFVEVDYGEGYCTRIVKNEDEEDKDSPYYEEEVECWCYAWPLEKLILNIYAKELPKYNLPINQFDDNYLDRLYKIIKGINS